MVRAFYILEVKEEIVFQVVIRNLIIEVKKVFYEGEQDEAF